MTQFTVTITRHVTACGDSLTGSVEAIVTSATAIDRDQMYVLEGSGWWATSDITSNLAPNGTSTGLNAQSTDQTATVISNVVATLGQVAIGAATRAVAPEPGRPAPPLPPICADAVKKAVDVLYPPPGSAKKPLKAAVDDSTAALTVATARVTLLTAESGVDPTLKKELVVALDQQSVLQAQLSADQMSLTKALQATSDTQVVTWPGTGSVFATDKPFTVDEDVLHHWAPHADVSSATREFAVYMALFVPSGDGNRWTDPVKPAAIDLKKAAPARPGQKAGAVQSTATDVDKGVPVRLGQTARLLICRRSACNADQAAQGAKNTDVMASSQTVLQLGQVYIVPVAGGTFRAETAVIALDVNGLPTSIEVAEKGAAAVALSGAAKEAATQIAGLPAQVAAARLAATQAKTSQLTANAALEIAQANSMIVGKTSSLAAQTALVNANTALATAQTNAGLPLQTATVNTQTALLNAQAALVTAQATSGVVDQTGALAAQTSLLNAQTAQINATAALAKAKIAVH